MTRSLSPYRLAILLLALSAGAPEASARGGGRVSGALRDKAAIEGSVRVIVQLDLSVVPEGRISRPQAAAQRGAIARRGEEVLARLPAGSFLAGHRYETIPFVSLAATPEALDALDAHPGVRGVQEDTLLEPVLADSTLIVGADEAWDRGYDGSGWAVAILDTGVDKNHPFLDGKVVSEACYSDKGSCPGGGRKATGPGTGTPCTWAPFGCQHGTHVAGVAAGDGGVARGASIISIRVFSKFTGDFCANQGEDPCALVFMSDIVAGLERVYALRADFSIAAANLSIGGEGYASQQVCDQANPAVKAIIDTLRSADIATVVASGNEGLTNRLSVPACISSAISVGATTKQDLVPLYSNTAAFLSLLAPGSSIRSSVPGGGFATFTGTSMAGPHVTGAWAIRRQSDPASTVADVLEDLSLSGTPVVDPRTSLATPRLDIGSALVTCEAVADPLTGDPPLLVTFTAVVDGGPGPVTSVWDFDDGSAPEPGGQVTHAFPAAGVHDVVMSGQDARGVDCSATVRVTVSGPVITRVVRKSSPFRLIVEGSGFEPGAIVRIDGVAAPVTLFKSPGRLVAGKGAALKAMVPAGVPVAITVMNQDGVTSSEFVFTR